MAIFFTILEQSRFILSFLFVRQAGWVHIVICITCNQLHIFVATGLKSLTLRFTRWAPFAMKWVAITFSLDCSKFLYCWLWFQQTQTLSKHFQLDLHKCHKLFLFHISSRKMVHKVFWTCSEYNFAQFRCLDLHLWLANSKFVSNFCLSSLSSCTTYSCTVNPQGQEPWLLY